MDCYSCVGVGGLTGQHVNVRHGLLGEIRLQVELDLTRSQHVLCFVSFISHGGHCQPQPLPRLALSHRV